MMNRWITALIWCQFGIYRTFNVIKTFSDKSEITVLILGRSLEGLRLERKPSSRCKIRSDNNWIIDQTEQCKLPWLHEKTITLRMQTLAQILILIWHESNIYIGNQIQIEQSWINTNLAWVQYLYRQPN